MHIYNQEIYKSCMPYIIDGGGIEESDNYQEPKRDYLYKLFNALELPIISLSYPDFKIKEYNKKAFSELKDITDMGGFIIESYENERSLLGMENLFRDYDEKAYIDKLKMTRCTVCHEKMGIKRLNKMTYYNVIYHPLFDGNGEINEILIVGIDVTHEVEKSTQMEEILKLKDEFLYFMSHEFKTPLTVINAAVQSLDNIYSDQIPDKARTLIERIRQNTYRQLRLVNNLLEITRINSGQIKVKKRNIDIVLLTRAITESVVIYAQQKGVGITFCTKLISRTIGMDDEKYERVLLNLLSNAIKFTPAGKTVEVQLFTKMHNNKRVICTRVKDEGIGIPKDKQGFIFEQFGQVDSKLSKQAEGSGIGLYLVKLMVEALGGEIFVESEEEKGSIFTLMLPSAKSKETRSICKNNQFSDSRLVQSLAIEFSDIYL